MMKVEPACMPCIMKQAYNTASRATKDPELLKRILVRAAAYLETLDFDQSPADASNRVYEITREVTGVADPFAAEKRKYNEVCASMLPRLRTIIEGSDDPYRAAARAAILGNLIDLGIGLEFDLERDMRNIFDVPFGVDDTAELQKMTSAGGLKILYLGDNAGEIVFDKLFVEKIMPRNAVTFSVKRGPIINDATREDAEFTGLTDLVEVIDTGSDGIGVKWGAASEEFLRHYRAADIIISKGQGNFETMNDRPGKKFFLLRAKCDSVARELGVSFGEIVLKKKITL
jgi:damage-control phosphatase, subfamily I